MKAGAAITAGAANGSQMSSVADRDAVPEGHVVLDLGRGVELRADRPPPWRPRVPPPCPLRPARPMQIVAVTSFAPVVPDPAASQAFYGGALGLSFEGRDGDYV